MLPHPTASSFGSAMMKCAPARGRGVVLTQPLAFEHFGRAPPHLGEAAAELAPLRFFQRGRSRRDGVARAYAVFDECRLEARDRRPKLLAVSIESARFAEGREHPGIAGHQRTVAR